MKATIFVEIDGQFYKAIEDEVFKQNYCPVCDCYPVCDKYVGNVCKDVLYGDFHFVKVPRKI